MTAADQPTTEPSAREVVESEVWAWLNRHDAPWSPSRLKVLDLTDAIEKALAPAPQPAADTETEVTEVNEVQAYALRTWIGTWPCTPGDGTFLSGVALDGLARADRIERGEEA